MNGFEQIKAFYSWVFNNPDKVRPTHISLYLFLWNQNNRSMWVEWFKCPYDLAMQGACIGNNKTYYNCLDQLQEWGLIEYKRGLNNYKAPMIRLIQLYDNTQLTEQVTVPLSAQVTAQLPVQLPVHIYKLITDNKELITNNLKKWIDSEIIIKDEKKIDFDVFWNLYDKKEQKDSCLVRWNKLDLETQMKIIDILPSFVAWKSDKQFRPNPQTFLNQKRWLDDIPQVKPKFVSMIPKEEDKW